MKESRFNRLLIPQVLAPGPAIDPSSSNRQPAVMCTAANNCPLRVVVRNTSVGITAFLALDNVQTLATLGTGIPSDCFELPAGMSETFVLAPGQKLYAASPGLGGVVTYAISEALPADFGDERRFAP